MRLLLAAVKTQPATRLGMAMVALAEQKVASKTPAHGLSGLALEPVRTGHGVETLWLGPGQHVIGSASECSHVLRANGIQPRHCEIRIDAGRATLRALEYKCDILWAMSDALTHAYVAGHIPPGAWTPEAK